jgi:hypothetical protein
MKPRVGDMMSTWFSDDASGLSRVLAVEPYRGKYPQWFSWVVKLTAPRTKRGWMEMAI